MKLKTIITVLSGVAVLSATGTGAIYYQSLKEAAVKRAEGEVEDHARTITNRLQAFLEEHLRTTAVVAGLPETRRVLTDPTDRSLRQVNALMDHARESLGIEVCYLMDDTGLTVAASNRATPKSFVGKNYAFRPYFAEALSGTPAVYMAVGVTSGKKGVYYSHPVKAFGKEVPPGVLVFKDGVGPMRKKLADLSAGHGGVTLLTGPRGVVFLSSEKSWEGKLLWRLSGPERAALAAGRQFGKGPWPWSGLSVDRSGRVADREGNRYLHARRRLPGFDGWQVVHLARLDAQIQEAVAPLKQTAGTVSLVMFFLVGISVWFLQRQAVSDLHKRQKIQEALAERESRMRQILDGIQAGVMLVSAETMEIVDVNPAAEAMIGASRSRILGAKCSRYMEIEDGHLCPVLDRGEQLYCNERHLIKADGERLPILKTVKKITIEKEPHLLETFTDISDLQAAKEALEEEHKVLLKIQASLEKAQKIASIGSWEWDRDRGKVTWSGEFARIFGMEDKEPTEEAIASLIHPEDRIDWQRRIKEAICETGEARSECRALRSDGSTIWVHIEAEVIRGADGGAAGLFGIVQDISDRKNWEETLRRQRDFLHTLMETIPNPMYHKDLQGRYAGCNAAFETFLGRTKEEIIGRTVFDIWPETAAVRYHELDLALFREPGSQHNQLKVKLPDGRRRDVVFDKATLHDKNGEITGLLGIVTDISELVAAREKAEEASRAKSEFLANMSHEIRTPLNGVIGMTELALDTALTGEQRDYLEAVRQSADNLMSIINDILDFSKIESGRVELENIGFHLRSTVEDAAETLAVKADEKGLELICDVSPGIPSWLVGDPGKLRQVLVNLGGNAVKFTETGEVVIRCREETRREDRVRLHFSVSDTGIGIPEDKLDAVFESFQQADSSTTRKFGGTGLGLSISKNFAELMGGRMWVESTRGRGSVFHFTADFRIQDRQEDETTRSGLAELSGRRVLIVDDNETNRRMLEEMTAAWHMAGKAVPGGKEGVEALEKAAAEDAPFDVVLLDLQMPELDGFDVARRVRGRADLPQPGIIMLTSMGRRGDAARCREEGIDAYLIKPIKMADLGEALRLVGGEAGVGAPETGTEPVTRHTLRDRRYGEGKQILLAEDDPINRKLAIRLLEKFGHRVTTAKDGAEAVARIKRRHFDLVLMDVQMPEKDGFSATREIRSMEKDRGGHVPIVAMTAHAVKGDREKCLSAGMDDYLSKPIHAETLAIKIDRWTGASTETGKAGEAPAEPEAEEYGGGSAAPVDMEKALDQVMGNRALLEELLDEFSREVAGQLESILSAAAAGDGERLRKEAHRLKGTAANLGAEPIAAASLALEKAAGEATSGETPLLVRKLETQIRRFQRFSAEQGSETGDGKAPA